SKVNEEVEDIAESTNKDKGIEQTSGQEEMLGQEGAVRREESRGSDEEPISKDKNRDWVEEDEVEI
ncbi:hypothetical protein HAX54_051669, partial [Datura stramonium]|nr:hypothetical protein [Datura stramonium]